MSKPFNPLLGETYELVTPDFRMISEAVSHQPPVTAFELEGPGFKLFRCAESSQKFNGRQVKVIQQNCAEITLDVKGGIGQERY